MRRFLVTAIALGMASQLYAKEGNSLRNTRGSAGTTQQVVVNSGEPSRGSARRTNQENRKGGAFSAERIVPDICTGC